MPFHFAISGKTPSRVRLMSVTIRFGCVRLVVGVVWNMSARPGRCGSTHRNISCGVLDGRYSETSCGLTAFAPARS